MSMYGPGDIVNTRKFILSGTGTGTYRGANPKFLQKAYNEVNNTTAAAGQVLKELENMPWYIKAGAVGVAALKLTSGMDVDFADIKDNAHETYDKIFAQMNPDLMLSNNDLINQLTSAQKEGLGAVMLSAGMLYADTTASAKPKDIVGIMSLVAAVYISGCTDENPIDTQSDDTLEDISDGAMTDASGTMDATLFKMAEEASGGYEPVPVAEKVQVEVLDDGSIAPYDIDNIPENLPADVAIDAYTHPEKYFSIIELPDGNLKIIGYQELNGWKITRSYDGDDGISIDETDLNNDVFGDVVMKTSYTKEKGNPSGNEITAVLTKNPEDGHVLAYVFLSPEWINEENYRMVKINIPNQPPEVPLPWRLETYRTNCKNYSSFPASDAETFRKIQVDDYEIPYILRDLSNAKINRDVRVISFRPNTCDPGNGETKGDIIYYDKIPGISIERTS